MEREKLSIEDIDAILHHEMTQRLGYDAKDHMMRVNYLAADGEPNWNANFASESPAPLPVLNAFIEALAHVAASNSGRAKHPAGHHRAHAFLHARPAQHGRRPPRLRATDALYS